MISVALIDDNRLVRDGLTLCMSALPDVRIARAVANADALSLEDVSPDVILLDLAPGKADSLAVVERLRRECPDARIIAIGVLPDQENVLQVIRAGVSGISLADASPEDLWTTIRSVVHGSNVLPHRVTDALFTQIADDAAPSHTSEEVDDVELTPRQREVVELITAGLSNKKIAAELHISVHTVKSHVRHIMRKLHRNTRLKIAAWARGEAAE